MGCTFQNLYDFAGYAFTKRDFIVPNLYEIHHDPRHFDDPGTFEPSRFIDEESGEFVPHPAVVPFGFGKRECLGKSLAKAEGGDSMCLL